MPERRKTQSQRPAPRMGGNAVKHPTSRPPPPMRGPNVGRSQPARPLQPIYPGANTRPNYPPGPMPPNRGPVPPMYQRPGSSQPQPNGGVKAFYSPAPYAPAFSGGQRSMGSGRQISGPVYPNQPGGQLRAVPGGIPRAPVRPPMGASGGAPQMPFGTGARQAVPSNPIDAMGSGEIRNQAYQAMQATRVGMMPYLSPYGRQVAQSTPFEMAYRGTTPAGYGGYYYSGPNRIMMFGANPDTLRHEYGHAFGFNQSPFGYPAGFGEAADQSNFRFGVERMFPGMFGNPYQTMPGGEQWGGPKEFYAQSQIEPTSINPNMRQFYPQFNQNAYQKPGYEWRWVNFEDGSSGWTYAPVTP